MAGVCIIALLFFSLAVINCFRILFSHPYAFSSGSLTLGLRTAFGELGKM
jgi:hypothetical protein